MKSEDLKETMELLYELSNYTRMLDNVLKKIDNATGREFDSMDNFIDILLLSIGDVMRQYLYGEIDELITEDDLPF